MDTLKILLAATVALLVGALAVALNKGGNGKEAESAEIAGIKLEIEKLRMERENLEAQRRLQTLQEANAKAPAAPAAPAINDQAIAEKIAELEAKNAALEASTAKAERKAETADQEAAFVGGQMLERRDNELRRARLISQATPMARVALWQADQGFAVVEVLEQDSVQEGTVLSVRRKTGILGKLKIDSITIEGAIANPVTTFPNGIQPEPGDDLIMDPME
jgi:hypothetical protein